MHRKDSKLRESRRRLIKLAALRRKRTEINDLINKELLYKNGAENLLNVCKNREIEEKLRVELIFMDSKVAYLKDQLSEINTDWSVFTNTPKCAKASKLLENLCIDAQNDAVSSSLTTSLISIPGEKFNSNNNVTNEKNNLSTDIMIYLPLKETINKLNFEIGFKQFIKLHFQEDPHNYTDQIKQFNYFRESTIRLSYEPDIDNIKRLFEYYNSLLLIEKRFFHQSQCNFIYFTWYDCINGIQSTQKSMQFEKASILFNCAALYTQIAGIRQNGIQTTKNADDLLSEQKLHWQSAAGCLQYLNGNFSNAPSMDMSSTILELFIEIFLCQAYEIDVKILLKGSKKKEFCNFILVSKIYAHVADRYSDTSMKINSSYALKNYLPEIWFHLIKVKSLNFKGLAHYYAAMALALSDFGNDQNDIESKKHFDSLHDINKLKSKLKLPNKIDTPYTIGTFENSYNQNQQTQLVELHQYYDYNILKINAKKRTNLARAHIRESIAFQEEALRQHGFCRKFSKNDYLHELLAYHHDMAMEKFMEYECEIESELFVVLPVDSNLDDTIVLDPVEPNFQDYVSKDFFNLLGPLKIYCSDYDLSSPYTCILKKLPNQQTYGLTLKGDCPVKVSIVDMKSCAYNAGIKEGDFVIAVQDNDVRWSKHAQVVEKIRTCSNFVKLTLINAKPIVNSLQQNFTTSTNSLLNANSIIKPTQSIKLNGKISRKKRFANSMSTIFNHGINNISRSSSTKYNAPPATNTNGHSNGTTSSNKIFNSLRLSFNKNIIGQKLKQNASKLNIFSSFKFKQKPEVTLKTNDVRKRKTGQIYKTI